MVIDVVHDDVVRLAMSTVGVHEAKTHLPRLLWRVAAGLPAHHRDPVDRLLIAQAQLEGLVLMSADRQLEPYDVALRWAG